LITDPDWDPALILKNFFKLKIIPVFVHHYQGVEKKQANDDISC
jgi:hypothetical protein